MSCFDRESNLTRVAYSSTFCQWTKVRTSWKAAWKHWSNHLNDQPWSKLHQYRRMPLLRHVSVAYWLQNTFPPSVPSSKTERVLASSGVVKCVFDAGLRGYKLGYGPKRSVSIFTIYLSKKKPHLRPKVNPGRKQWHDPRCKIWCVQSRRRFWRRFRWCVWTCQKGLQRYNKRK